MDRRDKKSKGTVLAKTVGKTTPKVKPTEGDVKSKGKAKAIPPPPAPVSVPASDGEEDVGALDDDDSDDETQPSSVSKPTKGQTKKPQRLGNLHPSKSLEVTLFDRMEKMWGGDIKQMLTVQYR